MLIDTDGIVAAALGKVERQLTEVLSSLATMNHKLGEIMSTDAAVQAVTAAMQGDLATLTGVMQQVASTLATAISEASGNPDNSVSDATLQALQGAQAQVDAFTQAAQQQANTEAGQVTPPAAPPAPSS
jgi:hypothetical protein